MNIIFGVIWGVTVMPLYVFGFMFANPIGIGLLAIFIPILVVEQFKKNKDNNIMKLKTSLIYRKTYSYIVSALIAASVLTIMVYFMLTDIFCNGDCDGVEGLGYFIPTGAFIIIASLVFSVLKLKKKLLLLSMGLVNDN